MRPPPHDSQKRTGLEILRYNIEQLDIKVWFYVNQFNDIELLSVVGIFWFWRNK